MNSKVKLLAQKVWKAKMAYLFLLPLIVGVAVFCYYPPLLAIFRSFTDWEVGKSQINYIGGENYVQLFNDPIFLKSIPNMLYMQLPILIIGIVAPLIMAELIFWVTNKRLSGAYRVLVLLPMIAPGVINTLIWTFIYKSNGILNNMLGVFGIDSSISWLNDARYVIPAIIFMGFPWVGGTSVLIYMSGLVNISGEVMEAARLDGAKTMRIVRSIHLPLLVGQIRYFLVFGLIGAFQNYGIQVVLDNSGVVAKNIVNDAIIVPGYYMYQQAFAYNNFSYACAIGTVIFVVVLLITALTFKVFNAQKFNLD